jgi:phage terminase large subunit GpA-like protein
MDLWNDPYIRKIIMCLPPRFGKTQIAFNCLHYPTDQDPDDAFYVMSDEKRAKRISKRQIRPFLESSPKTAELMSDRSDDTTQLSYQFTNGMNVMLDWATSPASLASEYVF